MNKTGIVIYSSKTGFAKRFAQWISEALSYDIVSYENRKAVCFEDYDTVIYGGGFYAGKIRNLKWFKEQMPQWEGKTMVVYATGATPTDAPETQQALKQNFTEGEWDKVKAFYFQSGLCYEKMGVLDKMLMKMFRKMLKKSPDKAEMYEMISRSYDCANQEMIQPLIASLFQ